MKASNDLIKKYSSDWYGGKIFNVFLLDKSESADKLFPGKSYDYRGICTKGGHTYHVYLVFDEEATA